MHSEAEFTAHHHGLPGSEVWQQHVFLHDVAGHFPEGPQVPGFPIYQDLTLHPCFPEQHEGQIPNISLPRQTLLINYTLCLYHTGLIYVIITVSESRLTCTLLECSSGWTSLPPMAP